MVKSPLGSLHKQWSFSYRRRREVSIHIMKAFPAFFIIYFIFHKGLLMGSLCIKESLSTAFANINNLISCYLVVTYSVLLMLEILCLFAICIFNYHNNLMT